MPRALFQATMDAIAEFDRREYPEGELQDHPDLVIDFVLFNDKKTG